ncbi:hypothetical protein CEXT_203491 [Caerostris extrusa]|uniref:Uncharacterized protein n=1 Tax=Caerostris extrusa TaxID=172846 RepID=A0AAV4P433_CAEEX|nr:hypothetical protein CEXT_203491 [Caerostris extrusa]
MLNNLQQILLPNFHNISKLSSEKGGEKRPMVQKGSRAPPKPHDPPSNPTLPPLLPLLFCHQPKSKSKSHQVNKTIPRTQPHPSKRVTQEVSFAQIVNNKSAAQPRTVNFTDSSPEGTWTRVTLKVTWPEGMSVPDPRGISCAVTGLASREHHELLQANRSRTRLICSVRKSD